MKIAEVFYSLQGEGILTGMPSAFIRFAGCNLNCAWCDTSYASWDPESKEWTEEAVLSEIEKYNTEYVVLTGGEPTIHAEMPALTQSLRALGKHVTMEVKKGDRVLIGKYAGNEIKIGDVEHVIVREDEILGIIQ